ncbi:uncharacterized protein LOC129298865 [Prosopis cineraria]|uniref:uncharacterized protein LOC129298865 n=1 Tax=Prosopis cineraria TaxID=364024 RepID=UPI00241005A8|nr:uncharacterized protein LOC129298865 [Prosopis cineraria]
MTPESHEGDSPKPKKESQAAAETSQFPPSHGSQSPYPPPQVTYYPPPMGYPPGQGPFGYPPPGGYPYAAQPPPPMYNASPYGAHNNNNRSSGSACFRSFVLFILMLILWYFVLVIIASSSYDHDPFYTVDSFSVSNFSTSNSALTCIWDTKINVTNPSSDNNVSFTDFTVHVYYNDEELIESPGKSLDVGQDQIGQLEMSANYNSGVQPQIPGSTVDAMTKDRDTGWLKFSLVLTAKATRNYQSTFFVWTLKQTIAAQCRDLNVRFVNGTGNATFNDEGDHVRCLMVLHY